MEKISKSKPRRSMLVLCDFCNSKPAVLYCRADSAKLCLFCDQQVHSANALSLKHVRSQICEGCKAKPASFRCSNDSLMLCPDCDWNSHNNSNICSVSPLHERSRVEGFSGCPSVTELASLFGFDLKPKDLVNLIPGFSLYEQDLLNLEDFMVPNDDSSISSALLSSVKLNHEVYRQLVEMGKRDLVRVSGDGAELGPGTPPITSADQGNFASFEVENGDDELLHQQTPFTSLLMLQNNLVLRQNDYVAEGELLWDCKPSYQASQIWDFQSGRLRDCEESGPEDTGCENGKNNNGFVMKNHKELAKGGSVSKTKVFQDMYDEMRHSMRCEDTLSRNNCNEAFSMYTPTTEESNNVAVAGSSSDSKVAEPLKVEGAKYFQIMDQDHHFLAANESKNEAKAKVDMELLAQNRGNAMLRYKEKKKHRRYDKQIRYESRKARADTRKRFKGRFVKASEAPDHIIG
ncbi:hypothetical protein PTKIN_Ptkin08bG0004600 [Pterospermum kingtungense]